MFPSIMHKALDSLIIKIPAVFLHLNTNFRDQSAKELRDSASKDK